MPQYQIGEETFRRKNLYLPCALNAQMDSMSEAEQARVMRETWWADNIANSEWPVVLGDEGASAVAKSRLKRKMIGWFMAMGRIAALNPELYNAAVEGAMAKYLDQLGEPHPMFGVRVDQHTERLEGAAEEVVPSETP